jgi:hypothetical protein
LNMWNISFGLSESLNLVQIIYLPPYVVALFEVYGRSLSFGPSASTSFCPCEILSCGPIKTINFGSNETLSYGPSKTVNLAQLRH